MAMSMNDRSLRGGLAGNAIRSRKFGNPRELWRTAEFGRRLRMGCIAAAMGGLLITSGCTTYDLYIDKQDADENLMHDDDGKLVKPLKLKPLEQLKFADRTDAKEAMKYVVRLRRAYEVRAIGLIDQKTFFQDLPLLGGGVSTGIAAAFGASTSTILGLGGGTAGIAGLTQFAGSKEKSKIYLKGASALLCVEQKGQPLVALSPEDSDTASGNSFEDILRKEVGALESEIKEAKITLDLLPKKAISAQTTPTSLKILVPMEKALDFMRESLSKAIKEAGDAVKKGKTAAGSTSGHPIYLAAVAVEHKVLSLLISTTVDAKKAAAGASAGAKSSTPKTTSKRGAAQAPRPTTDMGKVELAAKTIKSLNKKSAKIVKKATPVLAVKTDLKKCVDGIKK